MVQTKVINIFGGPGIGKTTTALTLSGFLKEKRQQVEFAPEYAKELAYKENSKEEFDNQIGLFAEQNRRVYSLVDKGLDYIVTDCPILQGLPYIHESHSKFKKNRYEWEQQFGWFLAKTFHMYNNINFLKVRDLNISYIGNGRIHTLEQAIVIDQLTEKMLDELQIEYKTIKTTQDIIRIGNWD